MVKGEGLSSGSQNTQLSVKLENLLLIRKANSKNVTNIPLNSIGTNFDKYRFGDGVWRRY